MSSKRRLSHNLTNSANKLKLDSINKIWKIDSVKGKRQRKDAISKQVSRIALSELIRNSSQASQMVPPDFKTFLQHEDNIKVFSEFLKASYCQENLDFYLACERYSKLDPDRVGKQMIKFMATQIYNDFLSEDARQPVNVDSARIDSIRSNMKDPQPDLLRDAQAEIFNLMKTDCYPRFCKTWQLDKEMAQKIIAPDEHRRNDCPQQATDISRNQSHNTTTTTIDRPHRVMFDESVSSRTDTISSRCRSHTSSSLASNECPSDCPYFRIGRLPCHQHGRGVAPEYRPETRSLKRAPEVELIKHVTDLKRIHRPPKLYPGQEERSPSPPPLPPKPDDIDYARIKTNKSYLPYVGKPFDV